MKTPVTVLTGFLGSGKTSLLNRALKDTAFADSAVVVNELGEIALDHLLVSEGRENIVLTETGCLCCAALESLPETLADLFGRRGRGEVPDFRRIFIETTGLADPAPILRVLLRDPIVSHFAVLDGLICTVDAVFGAAQLDGEREAREQAAMADRLVLTKTDLAEPDAVALLTRRLAQINPADNILVSTDHLAALLGPLDGLARPSTEHDHSRHDADVGAVSVWIEAPVTWAGLAAWTDWARSRYGAGLLRCKGLLDIAGAPVEVQGVQTIIDTRRRADWPDAERRGRLVLIGRGLDRAEIQASLSLLDDAKDPRP